MPAVPETVLGAVDTKMSKTQSLLSSCDRHAATNEPREVISAFPPDSRSGSREGVSDNSSHIDSFLSMWRACLKNWKCLKFQLFELIRAAAQIMQNRD